MTAPATEGSRQRRGRVLVVGDAPVAPALAARLARPALRSPDVFDAMGCIHRAAAGQPIAAVLVPSAALGDDGGRAAEALRRLDPAVRVVLVVEDERDGAAAPGFDAVLGPRSDPGALARMLGDGVILPPSPEAPTAPAPLQARALEPPQARSSQRAVPPELPTGAQGAESLEAPPRPATPGPPAPPPQPQPAPPPAEFRAGLTEDLGDTDLVHAVMHDADGVRDTALELIRQQTGWSDLRFVAPDAEEADDDRTPAAARAEIRESGLLRGALVTAKAATAELAPWARWIGHWLGLDAAYRQYRLLAYRDDLTGTWNRRYFNRFLADAIAEGCRRRRPVTVMVFDIDNFKRFNDAFGHEAGDVILCETVALLNSVIRGCDRVCRIGGDEFAVIFADLDEPRSTGSTHPQSVEQLARRFQEQIASMRFPKLGLEAPGTLSISGGLASYPWDGNEPSTLLRLADQRALESKRRGKNHLTFGPGGV